MKNYVLLGGHEFSEAGFFNTAMRAMKSVIENYDSITFIESRFYNLEKNTEGVKRILSWFRYHGLEFKEYFVIDDRLSIQDQHRIIRQSKNIFINGGDTLGQMSTFNRNGITPLLRDFDGPIIGISAGAINMGKRSVLPLTKLRIRSYDFKGIGLVGVSITPHFDITRKEHLRNEILPMSYKGLIYGLEEDGAILIKEEEIKFYGGVYEVHNGKALKING